MARVAPALLLSLVLLGATSVAVDRRMADPEDGALVENVYVNRYFDLAYPLPPGWKAGLDGPPPSYSGYYVLNAPVPRDDRKQTLLIAAQDVFFAVRPVTTALELATELWRDAGKADDGQIDHAPTEVTIAGRRFIRLELSATALSRVLLATDIRCHIVNFVIAGSDPAQLGQLASSLDAMSLPTPASTGGGETGDAAPVCIKDYATDATVLRRVEPRPAAPYFLRIPVRIVIGGDGKVTHVHVIRAFPEQKSSIETALRQWEFKPYLLDGRAREVETGLVFEFKPAEKTQRRPRE